MRRECAVKDVNPREAKAGGVHGGKIKDMIEKQIDEIVFELLPSRS